MAQRLLEARYVYHWNPLAGSLVGQLRGLGVEVESAVMATVTGLSVQPPPSPSAPLSPPALRGEMPKAEGGPMFAPHTQPIQIPARLRDGLKALGLRVAVLRRELHHRSPVESLHRRLIRRRIRRELAHDRAVTAFRAGLDTAGPTWGLIIGFDDDRAAWYRDGPLTEQVGPWLPEADFDHAPDFCAILARVRGAPEPDAVLEAATRAYSDAAPLVADTLRAWITVFEADAEIDPQGHAQTAQTLAAGWGEAADFWRSYPDSATAPVTQAVALTLSRYATLFPYPMGGVPNNPGMRRAATAILRETIGALE